MYQNCVSAVHTFGLSFSAAQNTTGTYGVQALLYWRAKHTYVIYIYIQKTMWLANVSVVPRSMYIDALCQH